MGSRVLLIADRGPRASRAITAVMAAGVGVVGLVGCGSESQGPEAGAVTVEDLQRLEDRIADLDDRVGDLEEGGDRGTEGGDDTAAVVDDSEAFFADAESYLGEQVTVSAEVSDLVATTEVGGAFRIAGEGSEPIAVVSATPPPQLDQSDVVRVTGPAMEVRQDSFEEDFGVAADELFEDADAWFADAEGQVAISADEIEVLQEQSSE